MYSNLSNFADKVDNAFIFILGIIIFFLVGLTITLVVFIFKFRESKHKKAEQIEGNAKLEIIWTVIPLLLVLGMFYFGWIGFKPMISPAPDDALPVTAQARMWKWNFIYENGKRTDTLYIPRGKPVELKLEALDVIHSLYIPAFRLKRDMIPGKEDDMWFIGNSPGRYDLFCSEYCGVDHSAMYTQVVVLPTDSFETWYVDTTKPKIQAKSGEPAGLTIIKNNGCLACHSLDGSKLLAPTWKGVFGKEETVTMNGQKQTVVVDEEYIKESIYEPNKAVVQGYKEGLMLSYEGIISEEEVDAIIDYIKTLE